MFSRILFSSLRSPYFMHFWINLYELSQTRARLLIMSCEVAVCCDERTRGKKAKAAFMFLGQRDISIWLARACIVANKNGAKRNFFMVCRGWNSRTKWRPCVARHTLAIISHNCSTRCCKISRSSGCSRREAIATLACLRFIPALPSCVIKFLRTPLRDAYANRETTRGGSLCEFR